MDFPKLYNFDLSYHLDKANVVASVLSYNAGRRPTSGVREIVFFAQILEYKELESLAQFDVSYAVEVEYGKEVAKIGAQTVCLALMEEIVYSQNWDCFVCQDGI